LNRGVYVFMEGCMRTKRGRRLIVNYIIR
jgi:hypothetical protein